MQNLTMFVEKMGLQGVEIYDNTPKGACESITEDPSREVFPLTRTKSFLNWAQWASGEGVRNHAANIIPPIKFRKKVMFMPYQVYHEALRRDEADMVEISYAISHTRLTG